MAGTTSGALRLRLLVVDVTVTLVLLAAAHATAAKLVSRRRTVRLLRRPTRRSNSST